MLRPVSSRPIVSGMLALTMPFTEQIGFDKGMVIGYASMIAAFLLVYFGVRSYRDNVAGGSVGFGRAFSVGMLIVLVSAVMYSATWQVLYFGFDSDFFVKAQAYQMETARTKGATQAGLELQAAKNRKYAEMYNNPVINFGITLLEPMPPGLIIALISAAVLSRRRRAEDGSPVLA